jgi:hypothetical protein
VHGAGGDTEGGRIRGKLNEAKRFGEVGRGWERLGVAERGWEWLVGAEEFW